MRIRRCDKCDREIKTEDKYIKCVEVGEKKDNYVRIMNGVGDLCLTCWEKIKEKNGNIKQKGK